MDFFYLRWELFSVFMLASNEFKDPSAAASDSNSVTESKHLGAVGACRGDLVPAQWLIFPAELR